MEVIYLATIGDNIKKIRKNKKMTQNEFASAIGMSRSYLGDLENNRKSPSAGTITKLSKSLGVPETYFFTGEEDYAKTLLKKLEKELNEDDSINRGAIPLIISDVESKLFPKFFPHDYNNHESLENDFNEFKKDALEIWMNYDKLDVELVTRIGKQISYTINDNLKYFYSDFYKNENHSINSGDKISDRSDEFIKRLQKLDEFNRTYIDSLRFLNNKKIVEQLDKIDVYKNTLEQ